MGGGYASIEIMPWTTWGLKREIYKQSSSSVNLRNLGWVLELYGPPGKPDTQFLIKIGPTFVSEPININKESVHGVLIERQAEASLNDTDGARCRYKPFVGCLS